LHCTAAGSKRHASGSPTTPSFRPSSVSHDASTASCSTAYLSIGMKLAASLCVACQIHICAKVWRVRYDDMPVTAIVS